MGCVDSTVHTPSLYTSMKPALKEKLREIISRDDIVNLVEFDLAENCPSHVELSENGLRWTTLHFCCRFDAPACLEYFLKKCFIEGANHYPYFVNQQTAQGLSCLHLCAIWSASRCLVLLLRYGALNLSLRDHRQKTAQAMLSEYGMPEFQRLLADFKAKEGVVTLWNFQLLQSLPEIQAIRGNVFYREQQAKMQDKLSKKVIDSSRSVEHSADELRLREQKGKLQKEREEIHCQLMKLQKQTVKNQKSVPATEESSNPQGEKRSEQVEKLALRLKSKQQEIEAVKYNMQKLLSQKNDNLLQEEAHRIDLQKQETVQLVKKISSEFQEFKYQILKNRNNPIYVQSQKTEGTAGLKQLYRKSIFSDNSSKYVQLNSARRSKIEEIQDLKKQINVDKNKFNRLPQHIQEKYRKAKNVRHFQDQDFPHNQNSLGGPSYQAKIKPFLSSLVWLRPCHFLSADFSLFDGIDPNDIKQGQLGVCYCLATISEYARNPKKIIDIFAYCDLQLGFYVLRFYTDGKPNYIVVDDYFPCNSVSKQPLFSKPIGNQIWVLLIEKAWAKIIGSYFAAEMMTPDLFMQDLTGSPTYGGWFKDQKQKVRQVVNYSKKGYLIVLTSGSRRIQGIVNNHAYSLLKVIQHEDAFIYKVRNPWGRFEWNGCYGEQSTLWTAQLKQKCEEVNGDDGIFFLSQSEVLQAFDYFSIGCDQPNAKYSYAQFKSDPQQSVYFKFTLSKPGMMAVRVTQPFKRIVKDKDYRYSPVVFQLGKIGDNSVVLLSEGNDKCYFGQKSVYASNDIYRQYEAGQYFVRLKVQWNSPKKYKSAVFSIYCDQLVTPERLEQAEGQKLWNQMLLSFIKGKRLRQLNEDVSYAMQWMRGQMICYSLLKESSKLDRVKVKWTFNANQLQNCILSSQRTSQSTLELNLDQTNKCAFGTLTRIDLGKSCKSGSVSIQSLKN